MAYGIGRAQVRTFALSLGLRTGQGAGIHSWLRAHDVTQTLSSLFPIPLEMLNFAVVMATPFPWLYVYVPRLDLGVTQQNHAQG